MSESKNQALIFVKSVPLTKKNPPQLRRHRLFWFLVALSFLAINSIIFQLFIVPSSRASQKIPQLSFDGAAQDLCAKELSDEKLLQNISKLNQDKNLVLECFISDLKILKNQFIPDKFLYTCVSVNQKLLEFYQEQEYLCDNDLNKLKNSLFSMLEQQNLIFTLVNDKAKNQQIVTQKQLNALTLANSRFTQAKQNYDVNFATLLQRLTPSQSKLLIQQIQ